MEGVFGQARVKKARGVSEWGEHSDRSRGESKRGCLNGGSIRTGTGEKSKEVV